MNKMRESLFRSIRFIYPQGVDNLEQFRDIIRIYYMGYIDAMMKVGNKSEIEKAYEFGRQMCAKEWLPDSSWQWWDGPSLV